MCLDRSNPCRRLVTQGPVRLNSRSPAFQALANGLECHASPVKWHCPSAHPRPRGHCVLRRASPIFREKICGVLATTLVSQRCVLTGRLAIRGIDHVNSLQCVWSDLPARSGRTRSAVRPLLSRMRSGTYGRGGEQGQSSHQPSHPRTMPVR